jgi:DNA-binding transcriptional regulator YiaG
VAKKKQPGRKRGGRKPGKWTLLTPEALRSWREGNGVSRARLASMLGVSSTSVQNWETGHAVATTKLQQRLAELTKSAPEAAAGRRPAGRQAVPVSVSAAGNGDPSLIQATSAIVIEAIRSNGKRGVSAKDLAVLIRTVRDALS